MIPSSCLRNISRFPSFLFLLALSLLSSCAQEKLVWDLAKVPVVRTGSPTEIRHSSFRITAQVEGNVKLKEKGFCIAHTPNPTIKEIKFLVDSGSAAYSGLLKNLWADTLYYIRAYASNATGTGYGNIVEVKTQAGFCPVLQTIAPVLSNGDKDLASGGNILDDGGYPILAKGICWSDQPSPVAGPGTSSNEGTGRESFTSSLKDLQPGKTYFIRAYATNKAGTCYGNLVSSNTQVILPTVITTPVSAITPTSSTGGGNITFDGGGSITARGICWSTSQNPTTDLSTKTNEGTGAGSFASSLTGLNPNTTYYVRAFATNSVGTAYANQISFTTQPVGLPVISTIDVSAITANSAISGGNISSDGGGNITARGVCWSTSQNPTIALGTKTVNGSGVGSFTSNVTGLSPGASYYVRAYATNNSGTAYGLQVPISTTSIANLNTIEISSITTVSAVSGGNIISDGGNSITSRGICWSTSPNPTTMLSTKTNNGTGTGAFTSNLTGLSQNTTYYVRSYATNSAGTSYGNQVVFSTIGTVSDIDGNTYQTIVIGSQIWMKENLKVSKYRNGNTIATNLDNSQWPGTLGGAYAEYNNSVYGKLYNYWAVKDSRGLCPIGWHVPSDLEWYMLENYVDVTINNPTSWYWRGVDAGAKLRAISSLWISSNIGASNVFNFSALPGGGREYQTGQLGGFGLVGSWWTSTNSNIDYATLRSISYDNSKIYKDSVPFNNGYSVRCLKD